MQIEVVEPFPVSAIPRVWTWMQEFRDRVCDEHSPKTLADFVDFWEQKQQRTWAVYRDGELGGVITFEQLGPDFGTAHCTFKKSFWGHQTTIPAIREAVSQMFASGVNELVLMPFETNNAIRSLLKQIGARETRKVVMMSLKKENFDADGGAYSRSDGGSRGGSGSIGEQQGSPDQHDRPDADHDQKSAA